jgi:indole-3-glycerol phosphate synthase
MTETPLERFARTALQAVEDGHYDVPDPVEAGPSLAAAVEDGGGIVAEIKPASPSEGTLAEDLDPAALAAGYGLAGAVGISVLTEPTAFEGSVANLQAAAEAGPATLLKDFVVHEAQVRAAAEAGAGAVLLIRELHTEGADLDLDEAVDLAHDHGLDVLLEVYDQEGLDHARRTEADVVGVNNRDLRDPDLPLDPKRAPRLLQDADLDRPAMALSGMKGPADVRDQLEAGADAVLVGTALMKQGRPATELRRWVSSS